MTQLLPPDPDRYDDWAAMVEEFGAYPPGSGMGEGSDTGREAYGRALTKFATMATTPPEGFVRATQSLVADESGAYVGFIQLRHELNDFLREAGGHIGYSVRPTRRREGHASAALGLVLDQARELALDRVLVTCDEDNTASARTIESRGGVLENCVTLPAGHPLGAGVKRRYWIAL